MPRASISLPGVALTTSLAALWVTLDVPTLGAGSTEPVALAIAGNAAPAASALEGSVAIAIEAPKKDPFARGVAKPAPAAESPTAPPPQPAPAPLPLAAALPEPTTPPMAHRFFGRMTQPSGAQVVLLSNGDAVRTIEAGTALDDGYVVESIHDDHIRTTYPPTGAVVDIPVPPPPASARR